MLRNRSVSMKVLYVLERSGNLKETPGSQGICDRIPEVREKSGSEIPF